MPLGTSAKLDSNFGENLSSLKFFMIVIDEFYDESSTHVNGDCCLMMPLIAHYEALIVYHKVVYYFYFYENFALLASDSVYRMTAYARHEELLSAFKFSTTH